MNNKEKLVDVCDKIKTSPEKLEEKLARFMAIFKILIESGEVDGEKIMRLSEREFKKILKEN